LITLYTNFDLLQRCCSHDFQKAVETLTLELLKEAWMWNKLSRNLITPIMDAFDKGEPMDPISHVYWLQFYPESISILGIILVKKAFFYL